MVLLALLCSLGVLPPQFALGAPPETRAHEDFLPGMGIAGSDNALPAVLGRYDLVVDSIKPWQVFKLFRVAMCALFRGVVL